MPISIPLSRPIQFAGRQVSELTLREPTWGDFEDMTWSVSARGLSMCTGDVQQVAARLSGLPIGEIKGLIPADGNAVWGALVPFLLGTPSSTSDGSPTS